MRSRLPATVTGSAPGSGSTASYNGATFTDVPVSTVDGAGDAAFNGYDTVLLYEVCDISAQLYEPSAANCRRTRSTSLSRWYARYSSNASSQALRAWWC